MYKKNNQDESVGGAYALGLASIGIGLTELCAPQQVENLLGLEDRQTYRGILRVLGVRELMHGLGILTASPSGGRLSSGVWARVAGDMLDNALLGVAATKTQRPGSFAAVAAAVGGIGVADLYYALKTPRHELRHA
jgi:hypothetical protein